jgi:DNA-binding cell septation regulator SpoVG
MIIKGMRPATGCGKTVAFFSLEFTVLIENLRMPVTVTECKLIEGKSGLFAAMPQKEFTQDGVKKYKNLVKLDKALQEKVNAAAVEAYRLLGGAAAAEPDPDIPW